MAGISTLIQKGLADLRTRGVRHTVRRTWLRFERKRLEKSYVRRMTPAPEELAAQRAESAGWGIRFSVVVPLYNTPPDVLSEMIASVRDQSYAEWELCLADGSDGGHARVGEFCRAQAAEDARIRYQKMAENRGISGNTNAALEMAAGDYVALFDHDDLLMPDALYEMAKAIRERGADFLYSDEMIFQAPRRKRAGGRPGTGAAGREKAERAEAPAVSGILPRVRIVGIRFKQDFFPEDLWTNNYICHLTVFRRELMARAGMFRSAYDGSQDHDFFLRMTDAAEKVIHVPKVLYLWRSLPGSTASDIHTKEYAIDSGRRAVEMFLCAHGHGEARAESTAAFPTMYRITEPIRGEPSVGIYYTEGPAPMAAEEKERRIRRWKESTAWRRCAWHEAKARAAAEAVNAFPEDYLVFVNGIPEEMNPDWAEQMLMLAQRESAGAVGAKVCFEGDGKIRHAGIILGLGPEGVAGRPYYDRDDDGVGFFGQLAVVRTVSAVTDCWMIRREKLEAAGGFDPEYQDSLFDIDLCLRLAERGWRPLWTPDAWLRMGRAGDFSLDAGREAASYARDRDVFLRKWRETVAKGDPCYNPNLSLAHEDWRLPSAKGR